MYKTVLLLALAATAEAGQPYLMYGGPLNTPEAPGIKTGVLGYQAPLSDIFDYKVEAGGYVFPSSTRYYVSPSLGLSTKTTPIFARIFFGPAALTSADDRLTSWWQFNHDLEIGLKGESGVSIGVDYKHLSNAGLSGANLGRDFLMLKVGFDL